MQEPTEEAEASIPTDTERDSPNLNGPFAERRKAAKRTLPWDLKAGELDLVSPSQAEEIRATKKPRFEEPFSASTDEAPTKIYSLDIAVSLPAAAAAAADDDDDDDHAGKEPVKGTHCWTTEEDAKLPSAVATTRKKKWDTEYRTDWPAVAALVPGRTKVQCWSRCRDGMDPNIDRATERTGSWAAVEDIKLKDAVRTHGGKNWGAIAALVPGRSKKAVLE
jgi:hypothetical protein